MTRPASYHVTADRKRFVREDDPEAAFVVAPVDIDRLGLGDALAAFLAPVEAPSAPPDKTTPRPADKRRRFPVKESHDGDR